MATARKEKEQPPTLRVDSPAPVSSFVERTDDNAVALFMEEEARTRRTVEEFKEAVALFEKEREIDNAEDLSCLLKEFLNTDRQLQGNVIHCALWHRILECQSMSALRGALESLTETEAASLLRELLDVRNVSCLLNDKPNFHCREAWVRELVKRFPRAPSDQTLLHNKNALAAMAAASVESQNPYSRCYARLTTVLDQCYRAQLRKQQTQVI